MGASIPGGQGRGAAQGSPCGVGRWIVPVAVGAALVALPLPFSELLSWRSALRPLLWPVFAAVLLVLVARLVPRVRWLRVFATVLLVLWVAAVVVAPTRPRLHFERDALLLTRRMTPESVDRVMAAHVKGMVATFGEPRQIVDGETYYEPRDEHHSNDESLRVAWREGRSIDVRLHID